MAMISDKRKKVGLSHQEIAGKAGVTRTAVSYIESGKRKPTLLMAIKLANAVGLDLSQVLKKAEQKFSDDKKI